MTSVAVLQARTNSSRLPAKVLLPVKGIPVVVLAAKRAANTGRKVVVATSREPGDDYLASLIEEQGLKCARGSLDNTLERIVTALDQHDDDTIVFRLTADNIFPDGALLDELEQDFVARKLDYLTCNGEPSGLPYGMSAEVTRLRHLREAANESNSAFDREHVTPYIARKFGATYFEKYKDLGKGHFRCTIDCLDDYLCAVRVFSQVEHPVSVSSFDLLERLEQCDYQPVTKKPMSNLVLGTVQLGQDYGIANEHGKPSQEVCEKIIKTAIANGVTYLDTARAYGRSEEVIGRALNNGWRDRVGIITKLSPLENCPPDASADTVISFVEASIFQSLARLNLQSIDVLMLHRAEHLYAWNAAVWQRLVEFKESGIINALGVSVQSPEEFVKLLSVKEISFIQMPFNILDWRWQDLTPKIRETRKQRELTIHARSALLQGLLASTDTGLWLQANTQDPDQLISWLADLTESFGRDSIADLCLAYVNAQDWIDAMVVGMENIEQLIENIKYLEKEPLTQSQTQIVRDMQPKVGEATLNPALWRRQV